LIALVVVVLAVLVVTAIVWARVVSARSATKSVETYERALGVLGEVSKRTESTGFRILPHEETGRPHVGRRVDEAGEGAPSGRRDVRIPGQGHLAPSRLPPAGEPKLRFSAPNRPGQLPEADRQPSGDERDQEARGPAKARPGVLAGATHTRARGHGTAEARARGEVYKSAAERHRQVMVRRVATGTAAVMAVMAVVAAAIFLSSGGRGPHATPPTSTTAVHHGTGGPSTTTTTTMPPTFLAPTSVSRSAVAFTVPSGRYTLTFQATGGRCWVGIEHTAAGPWLFAETLGAGQSATYEGAGTLVMRLGAPAYLSLTVNGLPAKLPGGFTQPYDVKLTPVTG